MSLVVCIPVLVAASILGNWFLAEFRRTRMTGKPWYAAYCTIPGLLIVFVIIMVPIALGMFYHVGQ
jgi:hypothetical protein